MSTGDLVTIAGRTFTLGAVYAPRTGSYGRVPRRLLEYATESPLPGGKVTVALVSSGQERVLAGTEWVAWAGEEVGGRALPTPSSAGSCSGSGRGS